MPNQSNIPWWPECVVWSIHFSLSCVLGFPKECIYSGAVLTDTSSDTSLQIILLDHILLLEGSVGLVVRHTSKSIYWLLHWSLTYKHNKYWWVLYATWSFHHFHVLFHVVRLVVRPGLVLLLTLVTTHKTTKLISLVK